MTNEEIRTLKEIRCALTSQIQAIDALLIAPKNVYRGPWKNPNNHIIPDEADALYYWDGQPAYMVPAWEWIDTIKVWCLKDC